MDVVICYNVTVIVQHRNFKTVSSGLDLSTYFCFMQLGRQKKKKQIVVFDWVAASRNFTSLLFAAFFKHVVCLLSPSVELRRISNI